MTVRSSGGPGLAHGLGPVQIGVCPKSSTLKNQGYAIDHSYGHGDKNLCFNFYLLTLIAFSFHQVYELTDKVYQACR